MPNLCTPRKITIGYGGSNVVITGGSSSNWCVRSLENRKRNSDRTAYGTPKSLGNKIYKPTLRWLLEDAYVSAAQLGPLETFIFLHQANPAILFTVQDEFDRMYTGMGAWHNKTIVPDSTVGEAAFYSCNAYLDLTGDKYYESVGADTVAIRGWSFMEAATN
jgi:hypothetical protein